MGKPTKRKLIADKRLVTVEELHGRPHAPVMALEELLPALTSPDSGKPLRMVDGCSRLTDGENEYPISDGTPVLYPVYVTEALQNGGLELAYYQDSKQQYFLLSQIKQQGDINALSSHVHYQRHLYRMGKFLDDCRGTVLDIGCDNVAISASLFSENCQYVGLDPFYNVRSRFRIVGCGEFLPFCDDSMDNIVLNTSLDHIFDYHRALEEAHRVLKPGGHIWLSTLIWLERAALHYDAVHFHHFRSYEIKGVFQELNFKEIMRREYSYKDDTHRYGLYLCAQKRKD